MSQPTPDHAVTERPAPDSRGRPLVWAFRLVSIAEAVSWLLLIVATAVKYGLDAPQGVHVLGPIHGGLFIAYVVVAIVVRRTAGWSLGRTALVLLASIVPAAPFWVERRWLPASSRTTEPAG